MSGSGFPTLIHVYICYTLIQVYICYTYTHVILLNNLFEMENHSPSGPFAVQHFEQFEE